MAILNGKPESKGALKVLGSPAGISASVQAVSRSPLHTVNLDYRFRSPPFALSHAVFPNRKDITF